MHATGRALRSLGARLKPSIRLRHWFVAVVAGVVLGGIAQVLEPADWGLWLVQTHLFREPASGRIVFAGADGELAAPDSAAARIKLARALDGLGRAGAGHIYLDLRLDRPSEPAADAALGAAIARLGDRISLVERPAPGRGTESTSVIPAASPVTPRIAGRANIVAAVYPQWPFGWVWSGYYGFSTGGQTTPSLATALAGAPAQRSGEFPIDFAIDKDSIPQLELVRFADQAAAPRNATNLIFGKKIVIGQADSQARGFNVAPGHVTASQSYVDIFAAETLLHGHDRAMSWPFTLAVLALLTLAGAASTAAVFRRRLYGVGLVALMAIYAFGAYAHIRTTLSPTLLFLCFYALMRWLANRRTALALVDPLTGMATLHSLTLDLADSERCSATAIVVARIVNYDDVLSSLPSHLHVQYALAVAERLRVADRNLKVYKASTGTYGWQAPRQAAVVIEDHLKGLRAIFAHPLVVDGIPVDTAVTFGVDSTGEANAVTKLAAASAAAGKATEAHQPVRQAREQAAGDRRFGASLMAMLDVAMERGELFTVFQPQYSLTTGTLVGVEALARWHDPMHGEVSPAYFITQCEQAGRMESLTRYVLDCSLAARDALVAARGPLEMSVNVSATLLADDTMIRVLRDALAALPGDGRGGDARGITLEITETTRIAEMGQAERTLTSLRAMGARISIDDFGVEAGNFLNLLRLPCDELKIDRAFVAGLKTNDRARHIIAALAHFSQASGVSSVAEGIEDAETMAMLAQLGCDIGQGYFLGRPMRLNVLLQHLAEITVANATAAA